MTQETNYTHLRWLAERNYSCQPPCTTLSPPFTTLTEEEEQSEERHCTQVTPEIAQVEFICNQVILPILVVIGIFGNGMVLWVFSKMPQRNSSAPIRLYLSGLMCADILVLLTGLYVFFLVKLLPILINATPYVYALAHFARMCSVWTSVVIAVDRWWAVKHPLKHETSRNVTMSKFAWAGVVLCSFVYCTPRFVDITIAESNCNGSIYQTVRGSEFRETFWYQLLYLLIANTIFMMLVPFSVIFTLNLCIYKRLRRAYEDRGRMSWLRVSQEHSTTVMLCFEAIVFLLCNSLPAIMNALEAFSESFYTLPLTSKYLVFFNNLLVMLNSATNFFVFYIFGSKFRRRVRQCCSRRHRRMSTTQSNPILGDFRRCSNFSTPTTGRRRYGSVINGTVESTMWWEFTPFVLIASMNSSVRDRKISAPN